MPRPATPSGSGTKALTPYVALLRGINVGGKNIIKMADLKACFQAQGLQGVATYIQSGNVAFRSPLGAAALTARLQAVLAKTFNYNASLVLFSQKQLQAVLKKAPPGFGSRPEKFRDDVLYLKPPLSPAQALALVPVKPGVDQCRPGPGVLYYSRLIAKATQSRLSKLTGMPVYQQMTIRNWATTQALAELLEQP
jgi:uncharacterized protein (DUF1697 family)